MQVYASWWKQQELSHANLFAQGNVWRQMLPVSPPLTPGWPHQAGWLRAQLTVLHSCQHIYSWDERNIVFQRSLSIKGVCSLCFRKPQGKWTSFRISQCFWPGWSRMQISWWTSKARLKGRWMEISSEFPVKWSTVSPTVCWVTKYFHIAFQHAAHKCSVPCIS